ncbi:adenylosuccinate lyase [Gemmatimonas aurantiaca]|nr:adenylosuccinate lyase [Gemmatimonas aurantiaca]
MIERYTLPEMGALWSTETMYRTWLEVELAACEAMAKDGTVPQKALKVILKKANFDIKRIEEIEAVTNHDVIAFLTSVGEFVGPEARYIHFGMTSSDVLDTALALRMKRAAGLIDKRIVQALAQLRKMVKKYAKTPCIGRTHGVMAEPTSVGLKFGVWYTELLRARARFKSATDEISVGAISGAVGNFANLDPKIEAYVCRKLGLKPAAVSTQVIQRDRHAAYLSALALLFSSIEKFATEVRNLQRTEIGEMQEGFAKGQKGSSAMPHKKNPITAERLTGIARLLRGYAVSGLENVALWHERDIAHSSVERVIIPDATILADYGLQKFNNLLSGLIVNKKQMLKNIYYKGGLVFSQRLLLKLAPLTSRETAYAIVQRNAMRAHDNADGTVLFREVIKQDKDVRAHLSDKEIDSLFDVEYYLKNVDKIITRVLKLK